MYRRIGVTLLELLITLGIFALLIALILPAVQAARTSARSLQCKNNIRQVALATTSFYDSKKRLPFGGALVDVLPYLDQIPLYNAMKPGGTPSANPSNEVLRMPSVLLCPERRPLDNYSLYVSYCMNDGGTTVPRSGLFGGDQLGRLEDASPDGLSNTVMFSERLDAPFDDPILPGDSRAESNRRLLRFRCNKFFGKRGEQDYLKHVATLDLRDFWPLQPCLLNGVALYDHIARPNHLAFTNGDPGSGPAALRYSMTPATSHHHNGVHSARCDGSVQFVPNSIDVFIWRALGTINYGDNVEE